MTDAQIEDAIAQMLSYTRGVESAYKEGIGEYEMISAREVLYKLGFTGADADIVLNKIAERGFSYCLDPYVECSGSYPDFKPHYPPQFACVWGIDQLRSRLESVR